MKRINLVITSLVLIGIVALGMAAMAHASELECRTMVTIELALPAAPAARPAFSDKERVCLAAMVYGEARNQPAEGQIAVAAVAVNRSLSGRWPADLCAVVSQRGQFYGYKVGLGVRERHASVEQGCRAAASAAALAATEQYSQLPGEIRELYFFSASKHSASLKIKDHYFSSV